MNSYLNELHIGSRIKVISRNEEGIIKDISKEHYYVEVASYREGYLCVSKEDVVGI